MDEPPETYSLLPKGIVHNTTEIYAHISGFDTVPAYNVYRYWHAYTITSKKLKDPTARRLENFWWHVWGSNRRNLKGRTLAKIYHEISHGPTVVELRGPPNRWEAPPVMRKPYLVPHPSFALTVTEQTRPEREPEKDAARRETDDRQDEEEDDAPTPQKKERTSSSARPPPTHSILKKPRKPSKSGPRPTARVISPHDSEEEPQRGVDVPTNSVAVTGAPEPRGSVGKKPEKKASPTVAKKFVVSSGAAKRRPALNRRPSSQSSTGSELSSTRDLVGSAGSRHSAGRTVAPIAEHAIADDAGSVDSSASSTQPDRPALSAKAAGKRPLADQRPVKTVGRAPSLASQDRPVVVQPPSVVPQVRSLDDVRRNMEPYTGPRSRNEPPRSPLSSTRMPDPSDDDLTPRPSRRQSNTEQGQGRPPPQGLLSSSVATTTNVDASGTIGTENYVPPLSSFPGMAVLEQAGSTLVSRPSASSLLEPRFTPTQPSPTPEIPFGRSKSQLTLLLEREKARIGDGKGKSPKDREERRR
jgi:hypothetical protein